MSENKKMQSSSSSEISMDSMEQVSGGLRLNKTHDRMLREAVTKVDQENQTTIDSLNDQIASAQRKISVLEKKLSHRG